MKNRRLLFGVTAAVSARAFLTGQLLHYADEGWETHLVCGELGLEDFAAEQAVYGLHVVPTHRDPSPHDLNSLSSLVQVVRDVDPVATIMSTPKMGVFGTLAARWAKVPIRVYFIWGYRAEGLTGLRRKALVTMERLACRAATHVVSISPSVRDILINEKVCQPDKVVVLGYGAANGIDITRFFVPSPDQKSKARKQFQVSSDTPLIVMIGRLTKDKGLRDVPLLWSMIRREFPTSQLLIAGTPEPRDEIDRQALKQLETMDGIRLLGQVKNVDELLRAADVLLFLSSREGMGQVPLEAAATGVPTVAYRVSGVVDTIEDQVTGVLCQLGDIESIASSVTGLLKNDKERKEMGEVARSRVVDRFSTSRVWGEWDRFLTSVMAKTGI